MTNRVAPLAAFVLPTLAAVLCAAPLQAEALPRPAAFAGPLERGGVPERLVPGRALVKLHGIDARRLELSRADDVEAQTALAELGKRCDVSLELVRAVLFGWALVEVRDPADHKRMPTEDETEKLIARIEQDDAVQAVSAEHWWKKLMVPNDPGLPQMWHLDAIGAQQAWDTTRGTSTQRVGVADTGLLRNHEDVGGRAVRGFDFVASAQAGNDGNGRDADFNDAGDSCSGEPSSFHGTHVAGTIGAAANNGKGVAGLNWNAGLVIARVLGRCGGSSVDIMEGAAWMAGAQVSGVPAIGADKVSVMNLSLGGANACSSFEQQAVDFIDGQGVVFVAAAGNDGGPVGSPASCNKVVTVAAFGPDNGLASYSSFGAQVDIVAPGGDQRFGQNAGVLSSIGPTSSGYAFLQGTSMASPHVAGAVSLLQAVNPALTRAQIVSALQAGGASCNSCSGKAMLNIPAALSAIGPATPPPATPPPAPPPPAGTDDAFEENDDLAHAVTAACGVDNATLVAAKNDLDTFTFTPPAGRRVAIAIHALNGADLDLYVTNAQGTILARSETTTGDERITGTASGARLGILVNPYADPNTGSAASGGYRFTVTCGQAAQAASAEFDPGDGTDDVDNTIPGGELGAPGDDSDPGAGPVDEAGTPADDVSRPSDTLPIEAPRPNVSASGGCSNSGASPWSATALVLAGLAVTRRRRRLR